MRSVNEAFIRHAGVDGRAGLLMPRMAAIGDLDLDEMLGSLLDPLGAVGIPPAIDPTERWLRLAQLLREEMGKDSPRGAALMRLARQAAMTMDRLLIEDIGPEEMFQDRILDQLGNLSGHWQDSLHLFMRVQARWLAHLQNHNSLDAAARRNRLFDHAARSWRVDPPKTPIVAAGITSAAPSLARLLRVVADLPEGAVILPDLDLALNDEVWDELGRAGAPREAGDEPFARDDAITHPQYHLKLLLNRMGVARDEVQQWHRRGEGAGPPERSYAISNLFLPPEASKKWVDLSAEKRRLAGVELLETANPEEEAQAIALLVRRAIVEPEKRVALVTPDRGLAHRVAHHLRRWNIEADDSAGQPLSQTPAGRLFLLLAETIAENAAPVPLMALLAHPLVRRGEDRGEWLSALRKLELELRGPRPAPGLETIARLAAEAKVAEWWESVADILSPLLDNAEASAMADLLDSLSKAANLFAGDHVWAKEDGRALAQFVEDLRLHARGVGTLIDPADLHGVLSDAMEAIAVRPSYGGHPRVAIYGLLEARMTRADLVICAGLNEGSWPAAPSVDPLLAPAIMRALGVPGADFRIGLSAHDLAGMLGAPQIVLSRARRDAAGPAIPSRFLLRVKALLGDKLAKSHIDHDTVALARGLSQPDRNAIAYAIPIPDPSPDQRDVAIAVTALDRLRGDPYQFYARSILNLRSLDALDAEPTPAWQGTVAHDILERWHKNGGVLADVADRVLDENNAHPLMRGLWLPRLVAALEWVEQSLVIDPERTIAAVETKSEMTVDGVRIHGRADRIDRLANGTLAIVDYKTGTPPSAKMVEQGFALQLGLIGLMARDGGIPGAHGEPSLFEYWSLGRDKSSETGFGYMKSPVKTENNRAKMLPDEFLPKTETDLRDAITRFIKGREPFQAKLNPDYPGYTDYDQLMRLDEWQGQLDLDRENGA